MRDANKLQDLKRRIEWPLMTATLAALLAFSTLGCTDDPLTAPAAVQILPAEATDQEQDAGERAAERQRDKNARSNGQADHQ